MINSPQIVEISEIIEETPTIKTFKFNTDIEANPGEFLMVWNFSDEKPMSISNISDGELSISVKNIGEFTSQLHELEVGDKIGVRGSYGNGFNTDFKDKKLLVIGGGVGMAPVTALTHDLVENNDVDVLVAATTKDELLFLDYLEKCGANVCPCTDDGSYGFEGYASDCLSSLLEDSSYDYAFVCGPEIMMIGIYNILEDAGIPADYSLERYMKCALGVCGQCCVDNTGWRICVEGPVFDNEQIKLIDEFGKYRRDASGVKY
ncbi:MAG: dihydroorotate dehydrogenase electron transfer subunit [Methanobrevibacter millerae]|uniref:Dihydroorotate dehydrogenase electron transfer subunit n=1 Tax=Methanobrevibacter millerae TaxID=230361 RepID=A0A8T3VJ12_9EURY|nr:dihydroorotate dehydrogenase electron transfer subunit [Methanobrevibacter millerae]